MANNNTAPATKVIVPCRISFANIWEPKSINGSDEKYSVSLLIPKDDKATLAKIKKAIEAAKEAAKEKKWSGKIPANLKLPMHDGDIDRPDDENYAGHFFFNATRAGRVSLATFSRPPGRPAWNSISCTLIRSIWSI